MAEARSRTFALAIALLMSLPAFAQSNLSSNNNTFFTPGNLVVTVQGCGVYGGTCTNIPNGTGNGTGNSSVGGYGDNQAAPLTLFQYAPTGTSSVSFVNSLVLQPTSSAGDVNLSGEYGSSSEGTLQLSGAGQYLTVMGYGVNAGGFNGNPSEYGSPGGELGQSGSLTGQSYIAVPRVVALIDANGNINTTTALYNIFNGNNPRSTYTADGMNIYVSGQGTSGDATGGVFFTMLGSSSVTSSITGDDGGTNESQDTRTVQIANDTLYVSMDSKTGSYNRSYIGTMGSPPYTTTYSCATAPGGICPTGDPNGPSLLSGFGNAGGTGRVKLTAAETNGINVSGEYINLSPSNYFFASSTVLYVADTGSPKNTSADNESPYSLCGAGGLQKWVKVSGTWTWEYTLYQGLNLVKNANSKSGDTTCSTNTDGTTGLYGLTGVVNSDGSVNLYATNFTIADLDPTFLYGITDCLAATTAGGSSGSCTTGQTTFTQLTAAPSDSNFKGVSFAPSIPAGDVEITTSPSGLTVTTSGTGCAPGTYIAPVTLSWTPGNSCTLSVVGTQVVSGTQYVFTQWADGTTSTSDTVTAPSTTAVYTANFNTTPGGLYSPAPGSTLTGSSATFQWFGPPQTTAFWIDVGSTAGGNNYYQSGSMPTTSLSATVNGLPTNGSMVYVTLWWLINGSWVPNPYTFTAFNTSGGLGVITTPPPNSTLTGSTVTFDWTAGMGASAYWLDAGSTVGGNNYYQSGNLGDVLTTTATGLPTNGSMVYVTLFTFVGGQWFYNQYTYTAYNLSSALAVMQTPANNTQIDGTQATFTWSAGTGAQNYWLDIGDSAGGNDIYQSGPLGMGTLMTTVSDLPNNGEEIYGTLWTELNGQWYYNSYQWQSGPSQTRPRGQHPPADQKHYPTR
ncbi:MAG: hypothetical protein ABSD98_05180 [Candidatus Korobacteraceae bacterium]|jgi:hypothetical protein